MIGVSPNGVQLVENQNSPDPKPATDGHRVTSEFRLMSRAGDETAMFRSAKALMGCKARGFDATLGMVADILLDDMVHIGRYFVVDTTGWRDGQNALISPVAVNEPDWTSCVLPVVLTRADVARSIGTDVDLPVSRNRETAIASLYNWPYYWEAEQPTELARRIARERPADLRTTRLISARELEGCRVVCSDGEWGSVVDSIVDTESWAFRYVIVASHSQPERLVLISFRWLTQFRADTRVAAFDVTRSQIDSAPDFEADSPLTRQAEENLFRHFQESFYW